MALAIGPNASPATVYTATAGGLHSFSLVLGSSGASELKLNGARLLAAPSSAGVNNQGQFLVYMEQGDTLDYEGPAAELHGRVPL